MSFEKDVCNRLIHNSLDSSLLAAARRFIFESTPVKYSYNFSWMDRPIIQYPQDMVAIQELIWKIKPDLIIETGIAHGGSLVLSASMMALLDYVDAVNSNSVLDPMQSSRKVIGIDVDIRSHNREAIGLHPMSHMIEMIEGSSVSKEVVDLVCIKSRKYKKIMVLLDSNHTHDHVYSELIAYTPLVSLGSYCVVFDTVIDELPKEMYPDRSWGPGDNPKTAVKQFLETSNDFRIDKNIDNKLLISVANCGYLERVKGRIID